MADLLDADTYGDFAVDIDVRGLNGFTPLHSAVCERQVDAVRFLLERGAEVNSVSDSLRTPLHLACRGEVELVKALVEAGADVNAQDAEGNTPLHILAEQGDAKAIEWLLEKEPDLTIKNRYGMLACEMASTVEVRSVFTNKADLRIGNNYSRTVMDGIVLHNNRADVIKSFMFKARLIESQERLAKEKLDGCEGSPSSKCAANKADASSKSRVTKILQATRNLKSASLEESKQSLENELAEETENGEDLVCSNDFEALNIIGKGSFGEVYLVKFKRNYKLYAMKVIKKKKFMSHSFIRYVKTEREVMRITKHPFIVRLHFAFQNADKLFMVMQYCPG
eukprot:TRINITY_DN9570_c0_g1_i1.p1 TRINITY_DN9570_c0_g1~~TRINITY_DN9570_c0_g1_i1.p1  ORF type:complete len:338 (+),score=88.77 TRINITY_DN9570_c0_g1_i1:498-1511(+)